MEVLELLMQSSDLYAPYTGVALTSYLEQNKELERIIVHFLSDGVSEYNLDKIINLVNRYNRIIHIYDTTEIVDEIESAGLSKFHGSYTTYCKLFILDKINFESDRVLYVDSDTLCNGSLQQLLDFKMDDYVCAMTANIEARFLEAEHITDYHKWYNAGVILFNAYEWKRRECLKTIRLFVRECKPQLYFAEQDLLNLLFRDQVKCLHQKYNYIYTYLLLPRKYARKVWLWDDLIDMELEEGWQSLIFHCMPVFGRRPWEVGAYVPQAVMWSDFSDLYGYGVFNAKKQSIIEKFQEFLYKNTLPVIYYIFYKAAIIQRSKKISKEIQYNRLLEQTNYFLKNHENMQLKD